MPACAPEERSAPAALLFAADSTEVILAVTVLGVPMLVSAVPVADTLAGPPVEELAKQDDTSSSTASKVVSETSQYVQDGNLFTGTEARPIRNNGRVRWTVGTD